MSERVKLPDEPAEDVIRRPAAYKCDDTITHVSVKNRDFWMNKFYERDRLVASVWKQLGREDHEGDDELPGIVRTAVVGNERLLARAQAAEARVAELEDKARR